MAELSLSFGFHPNQLEIDAGDLNIRTAPDHESIVADFRSVEVIESDWVYAPPQRARDFITGAVRDKPYSARVFRLPKTHTISHRRADDEDHLVFHLWSLSLFTGLRLTATEAGFLDATPVKPGKLVDFTPFSDDLSQSIDLTERFWTDNRRNPRQSHRFEAAVHALFLAQYPPALQFERFLYLYAALDACYALATEIQPPNARIAHAKRAEWLCQLFDMNVPEWADSSNSGGAEIAAIRNDAVHEALYMDQPLGFGLHGINSNQNLTLELQALICRFLVALIGGSNTSYVKSPVDTRSICRLSLT
ncbi:hypothetical protein [Ruegeria faecimaris]|uniref:hypothetical protein n=1 Tax=Ruegeria faecimaris TaxID=686389 RepID=UPI0024932825|nr:hypothetical protein [Ruegeria faecimaris]